MARVLSLKDYKKAKVYINHLQAILKVVDLSVAGLNHFEVYVPVRDILIVLRDQKKILEAHLIEQRNILKGRV